MKVNLSHPNEALLSLIHNFTQVIPLDANILIPSDRTKIASSAALTFDLYKKHWLDPLFKTFPYLAIHESVYEEVAVKPDLSVFVDQKIKQQLLILLKDSDLTPEEELVRKSVEQKIAAPTKYDPEIDNKDDRGEVKSLAYIYVKNLVYFCSHDSNALRLVDYADQLETNLESLQTLKLYDMIYYLYKMRMAPLQSMRFLYKFHYYLAPNEKTMNPGWNEFKTGMDQLYDMAIKQSKGKPEPLI